MNEPKTADKWIASSLAFVVGLLTMAIEGKWFGPDVLCWFTRSVAMIALASSVFGWGVLKRPGGGK
jgi:hypothetical protein